MQSGEHLMAFGRAIRWMRACVLGLFVAAQVAGVVPLLYDHTLNVVETVPVSAHHHRHVEPTATNPDADHHHGLLGLHDQCCALHMLTGPLPEILDTSSVAFALARLAPAEVVVLTGGISGLPDRPPKSLPLI
jgi:hypothetical protein